MTPEFMYQTVHKMAEKSLPTLLVSILPAQAFLLKTSDEMKTNWRDDHRDDVMV